MKAGSDTVAEPPWLWIIRGAPGVGKSAAARRLRRFLPSCAVVEVDVLRGMRADPRWTDENSHHLGLRQAARLASSFHGNRFHPVIVVDTLVGDRLAYFLAAADVPARVFTLIADGSELKKRARSRTDGFKDEERILTMDAALRTSSSAADRLIDTTQLTADEVSTAILRLSGMADVGPAAKPNHMSGIDSGFEVPVSTRGRIILARHANAQKGFKGPYEIWPGPPLSHEGKKEAEGLRDSLSSLSIDRCVASPFARTKETATIVMEGRGPIEESDEWAEVGPSEPYGAVKARVGAWLLRNLPGTGQTILVVGHGATLNAALSLLVPEEFARMPRDSHGLGTRKAAAWLIEWNKRGVEFSSVHRPA